MYARICNPLLSNSFFIFGARGTGKSTLARSLLAGEASAESLLVIDLLNPDDEERYSKNPGALTGDVQGRAQQLRWVLLDEVQRLPKLLDVVHLLMESPKTKHIQFALTGSSARKLKLVGANLLAGRAFMNELYPFTSSELGDSFNLDAALNWGTLPAIANLQNEVARQEYLRSYTRTYLKEEVWDQRLVHNLDPFRKFLEIAAQTNGTIVNYANIARDTGIDDKTVKKYFEILADTFLGFYLESYHRSVRKQQIQSPKFYLFDTGVKRAMEGMLNVPLVAGNFAYGRAFEHFLLCECMRLNSYHRLDYKFSYLKTKDDLEIDLIIDRPGRPSAIIEIKSSVQVDERDISVLRRFTDDFKGSEFYLFSNDPRPQILGGEIRRGEIQGGVKALPWIDGLREIGLSPKL